MKVWDYFGLHQITEEKDKIKRFKDTLFEITRQWAQILNYEEVIRFDYDSKNPDDKKASMKYLTFYKICK